MDKYYIYTQTSTNTYKFIYRYTLIKKQQRIFENQENCLKHIFDININIHLNILFIYTIYILYISGY